MPDFLFELFLGASVSTTAASATGTVGTITNVVGTSAVSATVGIASVDLATSADLKTGRYRVEVTSATDVAVYLLTDIDIKRGTDAEYQNDVLKITVADLTIPSTSGTIAIPNTGLEFTGGSGTVAMTVGDVAEFDIARPHGGISDITIGESSATFPEHSQLCLSAARSDGSIFEIEIHKAVASGFPIGLEETVFSIPELTVDLLYDSTKDALAKVRAVAGE